MNTASSATMAEGPATAQHRSEPFRDRFFRQVTAADWENWRWQLANSLQTLDDFQRVLHLSDDERRALSDGTGRAARVTPYYASLLGTNDPDDPLRRTVIPRTTEQLIAPGEMRDPLAEDAHMPVPGLVHRYPDRALLLVSRECPVYCRYCTRSRLVRGTAVGPPGRPASWEAAVDYVAATPAIRDVLISGGEPLLCNNHDLDLLLGRLQAIPHVEMLRLGSKVPIVLPQRITPALCRTLRRYQPLYLSLHVIHPRELTPAAAGACRRLADAGVVLGSQTVLLKGINDDATVMRALMHALLQNRVRPYYLLQCDPVPGSATFRTPVAAGLEIIRSLRGHTSGYAVPHFVLDCPGGGGKVTLDTDPVIGREGDFLVVENFEGKRFRYPDPVH